jgi:hypothetical protein
VKVRGRSALIWGVALFAIAGAAILLVSRQAPGAKAHGGSTARSERDAPDSASAVRARLDALGADVERLRVNQVALQARRMNDTGASPAAADSGPSDSVPAAFEPAVYEAELQDAFEKETFDSAWATQTEVSIGAAFQSPAFAGSELVSAECRNTMCRLEYKHGDAAAKNRFREGLTSDPAFQGITIYGNAHDEQQLHYVAYVSRKDGSLPQPALAETAAR